MVLQLVQTYHKPRRLPSPYFPTWTPVFESSLVQSWNILQHVTGLSFNIIYAYACDAYTWQNVAIISKSFFLLCVGPLFEASAQCLVDRAVQKPSIVDVESSQAMTWMPTPEIQWMCLRYRRTGNPAPDSWRYIASKGATGFKTQVLINTQAERNSHLRMVTFVGSAKKKTNSNFPLISRLCPSTWYKKPGKIPLSLCLGGDV